MIRISGENSWAIAQKLSTRPLSLKAGRVSYGWVSDSRDGRLVDEVLFLPFQAPKSFTGEDAVEIHCHGGLAVSRVILELCFLHGAEPSEGGEFTKRAFLNGRIDLTQAESILDLIHAEGEALVKLSANNLRHQGIAALLTRYLQEITQVQADMVASIDFPDEVEEPDRHQLANALEQTLLELETQIKVNQRNQVVRDGLEVALIGLPNSGKSSLFNALLQSDRSIVTDIAGTTRDVIRESLSLKGIPMTLVDTAGLRESEDTVEVMGVERSWQAVETSQLLIYVVDATQANWATDRAMLHKLPGKQGAVVFNKQDLAGFSPHEGLVPEGWQGLETSSLTGVGLDELLLWLESVVENLMDTSGVDYVLSQRQIRVFRLVCEELVEAQKTLKNPHIPLDLATVPLTRALLELQGLLGQDTTEQVLDSVFERFCVGK